MRRKSRQLLRHLSAKITWLKSQEEQSTQCIKLFPSLPLCNSFFFKPLTSCCWRGSFTDSDLIKSQTYASRQTSPNNSSRTAALQDNYRILNRTHDCGHKNSISPLMWRKVFCQHCFYWTASSSCFPVCTQSGLDTCDMLKTLKTVKRQHKLLTHTPLLDISNFLEVKGCFAKQLYSSVADRKMYLLNQHC